MQTTFRVLPVLWQVAACFSATQIRISKVASASLRAAGQRERHSVHVAQLSDPFMFSMMQPSLRFSSDADAMLRESVHDGVMQSMTRATSDHMGSVSSGSRNQRLLLIGLVLAAVVACGLMAYYGAFSESATGENVVAKTAEKGDGSWAKAYREAKGTRQEAIDLLFRCHIVSMQEFTSEAVEGERIEEYCWIAANMLSQRSVDDWARSPKDAKKTFVRNFEASFRISPIPETRQLPEEAQNNFKENFEATFPDRVEPKQAVSPTVWSRGPDIQRQASTAESAATESTFEESPRSSMYTTDGRSARDRLHLLTLTNDQQPSAQENRPSGTRSLPVHFLGPAPNIFKKGESLSRKPQGAGNEARGSGNDDVPVLDCSPNLAPVKEASVCGSSIEAPSGPSEKSASTTPIMNYRF